jgi:hypothetical protein
MQSYKRIQNKETSCIHLTSTPQRHTGLETRSDSTEAMLKEIREIRKTMECFREMRDSFKSLEEKVDKLLSSNDSFQSTQVESTWLFDSEKCTPSVFRFETYNQKRIILHPQKSMKGLN